MTAPHLPPLPHFESDGSRGWRILANLCDEYGLPDPGNPYAIGLIDVPGAGSYALAAITDDGGTLCESCVQDPRNPAHPAGSAGWYFRGDGWGIAAWTHSGEMDGPDWCEHCGREWTGLEDDQ